LFIVVQITTLLAPPVIVAFTAHAHTLSPMEQFRVALDEWFNFAVKRFDYAPDDVAFQWWFTFVSAFALLALGIVAALRAGAAYGVFVIVFFLVTVAHQVTAWHTGIGYFWRLEAWVTLIILFALWLFGVRRRHIA
jgi:hypothetical protein